MPNKINVILVQFAILHTMNKYKFSLIAIVLAITGLAYYVGVSGADQVNRGFDYGLDLAGGTQLTYQADISQLEATDVQGSISALRNVLETRLNALGSSDIKVTTETASVFSTDAENYYRVNVEIPGVFDATEAKNLIGKIPLLEFRLEADRETILNKIEELSTAGTSDESVLEENVLSNVNSLDPYDIYEHTGLTGRYVENAVLSAGHGSPEPTVLLQFDTEGAKIFGELTKNNIGREMAIFLDGQVISAPVLQAAILDGNAQISGNFTTETATDLVRDLKFGALPVPIELVSTQSISPSLGADVVSRGITAGAWTFIIVSLLLMFIYRLGGVVGTVALLMYSLLLLSFFKFTGIDLTAAGIAGFIITIGMAVDANILIFERIKEELSEKTGAVKKVEEAIRDGFSRAWLSIRDGNMSSIIVAIILYFFTTSFIKGFALTFGVGVLISMFTAITVTRSLLLAIASERGWVRNMLVGKIK